MVKKRALQDILWTATAPEREEVKVPRQIKIKKSLLFLCKMHTKYDIKARSKRTEEKKKNSSVWPEKSSRASYFQIKHTEEVNNLIDLSHIHLM